MNFVNFAAEINKSNSSPDMRKPIASVLLSLISITMFALTGAYLPEQTGRYELRMKDGHKDSSQKIFATSRCFDMLAALQYFDKVKDAPGFGHLAGDTAFMAALNKINSSVKASKLCNFYARFGSDRNDVDSLCAFFENLPGMSFPDEGWVRQIVELQEDLTHVLKSLRDSGYSMYWDNEVRPKLEAKIASYPIPDGMLDRIHAELTAFSGRDSLPPTHSKTYVMDIDNAFQLSDESFCCTPLLLDPELEKQFHLDFLKVYIHENLHRLPVSKELMDRLENLLADDFYRENEAVAASHNEGRNEAFVVAAEVYISHRLGRRDAEAVREEFKVYVDGSLVLAPIIYVNLDDKGADESLNDFIMRLFDSGVIKAGEVKARYEAAMKELEESM